MTSECEKDPDAAFCQCDPPCGAKCSVEGCTSDAEVLVPASQIFPEDFTALIVADGESSGDGIDGMLKSSDDWSAWVCLVHSS